jgi:hypothetical protein
VTLPFGLKQDDIDHAAQRLAELGYDVDARPPVEGVGVSPGLRMATYIALKGAEESRERREP